MSSAFRSAAFLLGAGLAFASPLPAQAPRVLTVCAAPDDLPFSNDESQGFENRVVEIVAKELGAEVQWVFFAQRRGAVRETLKAGRCDVLSAVPAEGYELALATIPYYRSSYVFVSRRDRGLGLASLDDPRLRELVVGVPAVAGDYGGSPPSLALARRRVIANVRGYSPLGPPGEANRIVADVVDGRLDAAIVWGPRAGWFVSRGAALDVRPVVPARDVTGVPLAFDIAMGVRKGDTALKAELDEAIRRSRPAIDRVLARFGVPR